MEYVNKNTSCELIYELKKLKESSKEAIEGIEEFSEFKEYMHVTREVELELFEKLKIIHEHKKSKQLVLVCGSVGDGKSHVISQLRHKHTWILDTFMVHNDATESDNPAKSYKEVLDEKLHPFSDSQIEDDEEYRIIIAINLGTLSNFIEDEKYKQKYSILRNYVVQNKIIEDEIAEEYRIDHISYVNFSDYSIFELEEDGPKSQFITSLLNKVVSAKNTNIFYKTYTMCCQKNCEYKNLCPLKINYELLSNEKIQKSITDLTIEAIIKYKIIVSARLFLDFVYNIIVPLEFEKLNDTNNLEKLTTRKNQQYMELGWLLPNILFDHKKRSSLFAGLNKVDPIIDRLEIVDNMMIELNTLSHHETTLKNYFEQEDIECFKTIMGDELFLDFDEKNIGPLTKTYIRSARLFQSNMLPERYLYKSFMKDLYKYNNNDIKGLKGLYIHISEAIYKWNGIAENNWINIDSSTVCKEYVLSQEFKIEPAIDMSCECKNVKTVHKFIAEIKLSFNSSDHGKSVDFHLDYDLYELTSKVRRGYRLNRRDRENYIAFIDSLKSLVNQGKKQQRIRISHKLADESREYYLEKDIFGGYKFG